MNRSIYLVSFICIFATTILNAQEHQTAGNEGMIPRRRALVLDIDARVLENDQVVASYDTQRKITIPGTPVSIQLVGSNLVVAVQFTPFIRRNGNVLVAQMQIGINNPDHSVSYFTSIQTIPMEFNEPILFFPLGQGTTSNASSIEITLTVNPHRININNDD
ncbi:MAG: hypothetical protein FWD26_03870 [Treponema sp.]|nr:hypothetical protein [Treponema sp.]